MVTKKRWRMNRMGFVNFWLYDNEVFEFSDGKLLLRGQNASGKSITTQSFIPFILDGNRSPSRLDPFGSNDRKMEYYFLGNTDSDDVTGYLYLEFKKEGIEEYRTIGIGQRARRGKNSMDFWGFVILDGRRIGYDFELADNKSNGRFIPYSKKELSNRLGSQNRIYYTQRDYMSAVNSYLFGFQPLSQYEQFIDLLIKIRAPKLSKEFKPSKVYDILNDSLQTLTNDDLSTMVNAMEKMDDIELSLENYRRAYDDITAIVKEYKKYNSFQLGLKAKNYINAADDVNRSEREYTSSQRQLEKVKTDINNYRNRLSELTENIRVYEAKLELLADSDLNKKTDEKLRLEEELGKLTSEISDLSRRLDKHYDLLRSAENELKRYSSELDEKQYDATKEKKELDTLNSVVRLPFHSEITALASDDNAIGNHDLGETLRRIKGQLRTRKDEVTRCLKKLEALEKAVRDLSEAEESLVQAKNEYHSFLQKVQLKEQEEVGCRDSLIEEWYSLPTENREYSPSAEELSKLSSVISSYGENGYSTGYSSIISEMYNQRYGKIFEKKAGLRAENEKLRSIFDEKQNELEELRSRKEIIPERSEESQAARQILQDNGIPFISLYEAIDFSENCSESRKILLEKQLIASGLIDSLIIPEDRRDDAFEVFKTNSEIIICPQPVLEKNSFLSAAEGISGELLPSVMDFLSSISNEERDSSSFVLSESGYFRNGILEGYAVLTENDSVRFIGAEARRRQREQLIAEKEEELRILREKIDELKNAISQCDVRIQTLKNEYNAAPKIDKLDRVLREKNRLKLELENSGKNCERCEAVFSEASKNKDRLSREAVSACAEFPYPRSVEGYEEVSGSLVDYERSVDVLGYVLRDIQVLVTNIGISRERILERNYEIEALDSDLTERKSKRNILKATSKNHPN